MAPPRGRGRGRGCFQNRGRGGRMNRGNSGPRIEEKSESMENLASVAGSGEGIDMKTVDPRTIFLEPASVEVHIAAQTQDPIRYKAALLTFEKNGIEILTAAKIRSLAGAWMRKDREMAEFLLSDGKRITIVEITKALALLDGGRRGRAWEKRMAAMKQNQKKAGKKGKSRLGRRLVEMKKTLNNLNANKIKNGSVSGALCRQIKKWTRSLPADQLEFYALHLPSEPWKQLADICHLNSEKDFPNLPWFLKFCFDPSAAPENSMAARCKGLGPNNVNELIAETDIPFAHLKPYARALTEKSKERIATYTPDLDTVIWNYEDLKCDLVDKVIYERLSKGEKVHLPYGKLLERLLLIRKYRKDSPTSAGFYHKLLPQAEELLKGINIPLEAPVVVIGDASPSMDVAIEVSTIVGSFLRAAINAQLVFFCDWIMEPPFIPANVEQVLELAMVVKTQLGTCPAAALWPFYQRKEVVKTFVIVTDEEENSRYVHEDGDTRETYTFRMLFEKYYKEVYPSKLVFISFLRQQHAPSQMCRQLREDGHTVMQFKLDKNRPDLSKMNNMIGQVSLDAQKNFDEQLKSTEEELRKKSEWEVVDTTAMEAMEII